MKFTNHLTHLILLLSFLTFYSCEKENIKDNTNPDLESIESNNEFDLEIVGTIKSDLLKGLFTIEPTDDEATEKVGKIFSSLTIEESKELNEIITKLELHAIKSFGLTSEELSTAKAEIYEADLTRKRLNNLAVTGFQKSVWALTPQELSDFNSSQQTVESRVTCSSRKKKFGKTASKTSWVFYNSNCASSYNVKSCKNVSNGYYYNCDSDCDWEFRFTSNDKFYNRWRVCWSYNSYRYPLAFIISGGISTFHGNTLGRRTSSWGGKKHTFLQIGFPDKLKDTANIGSVFGRSILKGFLSMHRVD